MKIETNHYTASVVMSACATKQAFFEEAVRSVFEQDTSDFEFIIVDDGLSRENKEYLRSISDPRLKVLVNEVNLGQSRSVNKAIAQAKGDFIIRMDADDVMLPMRISDEVAFMKEHKEVLAAGAFARRSNDGRIIPRRYPSTEALEMGLLFACDMVHPTMVIRREAALLVGLSYDEGQKYAQDYMFWADTLERGDIAFIPEVVLEYRVHSGQISKNKTRDQLTCGSKAQAKMFKKFDITLSETQLSLLSDFVAGTNGGSVLDHHEIIRSLREKCYEGMEASQFELFSRELSFRVLKAGLRGLLSGKFIDTLRSVEFWKALISINYWSFYAKALRPAFE